MAGERFYYKNFLVDLRNNGPRSVYIFSGQENFLKEEALETLIKATLFEKEREYGVENLMAGGAITGREVVERATTLPFFSKRRLIIVKNVNVWKKKDLDEIVAYAERPLVTTFLVLVSTEEKLEMETWKSLLRTQMHVEFWPMFDNQLENWVVGKFTEHGKTIGYGTTQLLLELVGKSMTDLNNEITKVLQFIGNSYSVTDDDISKVVCPSKENTVYELIEALEQRHVPHALKTLDKLLADKVKPEEIMPLLSWKFRKYLWALVEKENGNLYDDIIFSFKLPKAREEFITRLHQYTLANAVFIIKELDTFEKYLKSGGQNWRYYMNLLMIKLCVWREV